MVVFVYLTHKYIYFDMKKKKNQKKIKTYIIKIYMFVWEYVVGGQVLLDGGGVGQGVFG